MSMSTISSVRAPPVAMSIHSVCPFPSVDNTCPCMPYVLGVGYGTFPSSTASRRSMNSSCLVISASIVPSGCGAFSIRKIKLTVPTSTPEYSNRISTGNLPASPVMSVELSTVTTLSVSVQAIENPTPDGLTPMMVAVVPAGMEAAVAPSYTLNWSGTPASYWLMPM